MNLVRHVFDIQAPPESVFAAITSADGLSSWWTTEVRADDAELGSLFRFTFRGAFAPELRITEIEPPTHVAWEGVRGHDAWGATTIRFRLDRLDAGTLVHFWHQMGPEHSEEAVASANFRLGVLPRQPPPPVRDGPRQAVSAGRCRCTCRVLHVRMVKGLHTDAVVPDVVDGPRVVHRSRRPARGVAPSPCHSCAEGSAIAPTYGDAATDGHPHDPPDEEVSPKVAMARSRSAGRQWRIGWCCLVRRAKVPPPELRAGHPGPSRGAGGWGAVRTLV